MLEVPLVAHDNDGYGCSRQFTLGLSDTLHLLPHYVEARPVADAVNQDEAVRPLELSLIDVPSFVAVLKQKAQTLQLKNARTVIHGHRHFYPCKS